MTIYHNGSLPIFPCLDYAPITDERIERVVCRLVDHADALFMADNSKVTQQQYDAWHKKLDNWANQQYDKARHQSAFNSFVASYTE